MTRTTAAVVMAILAACDANSREELAEKTRAGAEAAGKEAGALAEKTRAGAGEWADAASKEAGALAEKTRAGAGEWATRMVQRGELTETARGWLRKGSELSQSGIEAALAKGSQVVPTALAIGGALATAVDSDTMLEPIYQPVSEAGIGSAEAEAAIRGMARVEPIAGLQVGFKELTSMDVGHRISEQAYLVVWQQDQHLVGFVFRSRRDIDLAEVVSLAPKLVGLARGAL